MSWSSTLSKAIQGTTAVAAVITAAPVFGPVGVLTAGGFVVASVIGGIAAITDSVMEQPEPPLIEHQ